MLEGILEVGWMPAVQLAVVLVVGALASFTDLREGVIRNSHVAVLVLVGAPIAFGQAFSSNGLEWWLAGAFMSFSLPSLLWWRSFISAGDAKLLIAMGVSLPAWWYPSFAPVLFPFSIVFFLAFAILAVPMVFGMVFFRRPSGVQAFIGSSPLPAARERVEARSAEEAPSGEARPVSLRRYVGKGGLVSSVILPSWVFILLWQGWISAAGNGLDSGLVVAGAAVLMVLSFFLRDVIVRLGMPLWCSVLSLLVVTALCVRAGAGLFVLALTASGALLLVVSAGFLRDKVGQVASSQEVRFAHVLFLAVIIIGAAHLIEIGLSGAALTVSGAHALVGLGGR